MKGRQLIILAVLAVAMTGTALWLSAIRSAPQQAELQQDALPGLAERINKIEKVVLTGAGNQVIATLQRQEANWLLNERNYPADTAALRSLLLTLSEARRVEAKTANPELYSKLGVEDVEAAEAKGVKLELLGGGEPLAIIVGQNNPRGKGTYVRLAGEKASWMLDRNLAVEKSTANWLQRQLVDVQPDRIAELLIEQGKERIEIAPSEAADGDFQLRNLPKGREQASDFVADGSAGLLQDLRFEDVADAASKPEVEPVRSARFSLKDGLRIGLRAWTDAEKTWAGFSVEFDEAAAVAGIEAAQVQAKVEWDAKQAALAKPEAATDAVPEAPADAAVDADAATDAAALPATADAADAAEPAPAAEEIAAEAPLAVRDPAADREARLGELRTQFEQLKARFEGRVFQLPSFKASNLNRDLEAYLKPKS